MRTFLLVTIIGFVLATLAAIGAPQPLASPAAPAKAECDCSNLDALQIELRNALRLQQAFRNKIADLRKMEMEGLTSLAELKHWTESDARRGLEKLPGSSGAAQVDYKPWGDQLHYQDDEGVTSKFTNEKLCGRSDESDKALEEAKKKSACAGIAQAIQVHEDWHLNLCRTMGYRPYWLGMHGADRAQEEVDAYGAQIAVLRAEIAKALERANVRIETESDGQWRGTITYTVVRNVVSHRTKPSDTNVYITTEGGHDNSDETETWSGTVVVDGRSGMADSSYDYILTMDEETHGTTVCCTGAAPCNGRTIGRIPWSNQHSLTRYASGSGLGKVSVYIVLEKDGYKVETSTAAVNVTSQENTQSSGKLCIGNHPGSLPATNDSQSHTGMGGGKDLPAGKGKYGPDPNKLSGSDTSTTTNGTVTTLTWNLRRCH
jgi:hypothetical protein